MTPKFSSGDVVATPLALKTHGQPYLTECLQRHLSMDWGDLDPWDDYANTLAIESKAPLFSTYIREGPLDFAKHVDITTDASRTNTLISLRTERGTR